MSEAGLTLEFDVERLADAIADRVASKLNARPPETSDAEEWHLVDVEEAGHRLGRSGRWVRERVKCGELPAVRLDGGALAFELDDLQAFAGAHRIPPADEEELSRPRLKAVAEGKGWWEK